jgi:dihydropyrimidinase
MQLLEGNFQSQELDYIHNYTRGNNMYDLILKNGLIIKPEESFYADIAIKDEKFALIEPFGIDDEAKRVIDLQGKFIMAGIIDPHNHIHARFGGIIDDLDFYSASRAAAFGGVTMLIDFSESKKGSSVLEAVKSRIEDMKISAIDYSVHAKIIEATQAVIDEIRDIIDFGVPTMKMFMTYRNAGVMIEDEDILRVMEECRKYGGRPGFHAESNVIAEYNERKFKESGTLGWEYFEKAKSNICELEAVNRVIAYSEFLDCPIYIFHLSTKEGKKAVEEAQKRGIKVLTETCPHYLTMTKEKYKRPDGYLYMMSPPLRSKVDQKALWEGLNDGVISLIGSDNCTFSKKVKETNLERNPDGSIVRDYTKVINGSCGIEERLALLINSGINAGKITWNKLTQITSQNPAKVFGMYPQKGTISIGSDADLVIVDPNKEEIISARTLHYGLDYSIYEGIKVKGWPVMTIRRGDILVENGEFIGDRGSGKFVRRKLK